MIEIYAPWSKELVNDIAALEHIKNSGIFAGIETCSLDDIDNVLKVGLKVSIHNPLRMYFSPNTSDYANQSLENCDITPVLEHMKDRLKINHAKTMGFHAGYSALKYDLDPIIIKNNCIKTLNMLTSNFKEKIVFETLSINFEEKDSPSRRYVTSTEFIKDLLSPKVGFLFDISHVYLATYYRSQFFKTNFEYEMNEKMMLVANKTHQVHINVFQGNENTEYKDIHNYFTDSNNTKIVFDIMQKLFEAKAPIETITLEFKVPGNGMEQAIIMVDCGKMFLEKFGKYMQ